MARFRITTWPQGPIRLAPAQEAAIICPVRDATLDYACSGIAAIVGVGSVDSDLPPHMRAALPDELYLRGLRELELGDAHAVVDFAGKYGLMGLTGGLPLGEVPYLRALADIGPYAPLLLNEGDMGVSVNALRAVDRSEKMFSLERGEHWIKQGKSYETIDQFLLAARWIRDLTTIALHLDDLEDGPPTWESRWLKRPEHRMGALLQLRWGLTALLRPFSPRIEFGEDDELDDDDLSEEMREYLRQPEVRVPLVSALAMQLYNHLAEQATFRICGNERCRRSFVTQQGRARFGQHHRTGRVKYCSLQCARAQATREHRRRKAAAEGDAT